MACNQNRLNCTPDQIMAATAVKQCSIFGDPSVMQAEQLVFDRSYQDLINSFGVKVNYYINTFNLSAADLLYGEHPTSIFYGPVEMMMYVEINNESISLQSFGFDAADEFTGYVSIRSFDLIGDNYTTLNKYLSNGQSIEPKSGDLLEVTSLGCDRPNGRGTKIFEVTERVDQDISTINPLLGHYVYRLRAKRYEYSFEPGAPKELANQQIFENSFSGTISSNIPGVEVSDDKVYEEDIDDISRNDVYDMDSADNDIYGDYY